MSKLLARRRTHGRAVAPLPQLNLTQVASDNFNRANGPIAGSNNWLATSEAGSLAVAANEAIAPAATAAGAYRTAEVYASNQYSQAQVGSVPLVSGGYIGVSVRNQDSQNNYTAIYFNNAGAYSLVLFKKVAGSFGAALATLTLSGAQPQGTILRIVAEGSVISATIGGTTLGAVVIDATFTGGAPGVELFGANSLDSWVGGNAATGPAGVATATDNFNRADGNVSAGNPSWALMNYVATPATVEAPIIGNQISTQNPPVTNHAGDVRVDAFNSDHWSAIQNAGAMSATGFLMGSVRNQGAGATLGNAGYIGGLFNNVAYQIYRLDNGTPGSSTLLAGAATPGNDPAGTEYKVVARGSRISLRVKPPGGTEAEVLATTDAAYAGGAPGIMTFPNSIGDNWSGGNV